MNLYPQHTIDIITNSSSELFIIREPSQVKARKLIGFTYARDFFGIDYLDEDSAESLLCVYENIIVPRFKEEVSKLNGGTLYSYNKDSFIIPEHIKPVTTITDWLLLYEEWVKPYNLPSDYTITRYNEYKEGKPPRYELQIKEPSNIFDLDIKIQELAKELIRTELKDCFQITLDTNTGYDEFIEEEFDIVSRTEY